MTNLFPTSEGTTVGAEWDHVRQRERLDGVPTVARRVMARLSRRARRGANRRFEPLKTGSLMTQNGLRIYEGPSNQIRFQRSLDYVSKDDRVFEIGLGRGYFAGLLIRDGEIAAHRGIDLQKRNVRATRQLLELNGLAERSQLSVGDLYDLTRTEVEKFGANLMVCCEVLEHVPDPEAAVRTLAEALPDDGELLVSVPLLGRLERVWGHISIFDHHRIREMMDQAGLVVHDVDVVFDTWVFVLASHSNRPNGRAARAQSARADSKADGSARGRMGPPYENALVPRSVRRVDVDASGVRPLWKSRISRCDVGVTSDGHITCEMAAATGLRAGVGGVQLPLAAPLGARLELALDDIDAVRRLFIDTYNGRTRIARWSARVRRVSSNRVTVVLRPRIHDPVFRSVEHNGDGAADSIVISTVVQPGRQAGFRVLRVAVYE